MNHLNNDSSYEQDEPHDSSFCCCCGCVMSDDWSDDEYCSNCQDIYN